MFSDAPSLPGIARCSCRMASLPIHVVWSGPLCGIAAFIAAWCEIGYSGGSAKARCGVEDRSKTPHLASHRVLLLHHKLCLGHRYLSLLGQVRTQYREERPTETVVQTTYFSGNCRRKAGRSEKPRDFAATIVLCAANSPGLKGLRDRCLAAPQVLCRQSLMIG